MVRQQQRIARRMTRGGHLRVCAVLAGSLLACALVRAQSVALPENDGRVHQGVATCASTVCHGRVNAAEDETVWLNEYRIWLRQDYHSRAYRTLLTEQSKAIAAKLGLAAAHTADVCLDCHADNVPAQHRGDRFQIDDGVGCEACHGGSEAWLESHAEAGTSHADNIARGLYPTEDPVARAELCLSCHLGTDSKFASHDIMGAGHPRLSFELETFSVNQPAHYAVDPDYEERKGSTSAIATWLAGLATSSAQLLELMSGPQFSSEGLFPELSFYQCHACHHGMDNLRWQQDALAPALGPGSVRLNDGPLSVLVLCLDTLQPETAGALRPALARLHRSAERSRAELQQAAAELAGQLNALATELAQSRYDKGQQRELRLQLLRDSAAGRHSYYTAAEQAFLAVETLTISLGDAEAIKQPLDALYEALGSEYGYQPERYAAQARALLAVL